MRSDLWSDCALMKSVGSFISQGALGAVLAIILTTLGDYIFFFKKIEIYLIYIAVLLSGVQQSDSVTNIYFFRFFQL